MNCDRCDKEIPAERLEVLPDTRLCVGCSEVVGGDFIMVSRSCNIGKEGSMKKNYGGGATLVNLGRRRIVPLSAESDE